VEFTVAFLQLLLTVGDNALIRFCMANAVLPLLPPLDDMPEALREIRDERRRAFAWNYVFCAGNGAEAARAAGYSDHLEACKVAAHRQLQRDDVHAAIKELTTKYLFSLAPKAIFRLTEILDNPNHPRHIKAIEMALDRTGHAPQTEHKVTVEHVNDGRFAELAARLATELGVERAKMLGENVKVIEHKAEDVSRGTIGESDGEG
jgi:hypothetical protein